MDCERDSTAAMRPRACHRCYAASVAFPIRTNMPKTASFDPGVTRDITMVITDVILDVSDDLGEEDARNLPNPPSKLPIASMAEARRADVSGDADGRRAAEFLHLQRQGVPRHRHDPHESRRDAEVGSSNGFIHPIHIHGGPFVVVARDRQTLPPAARFLADTVNVGPGQRATT